ncbi:porin family protein [Propionivibrio sp.]|uniref:porin family protein n=1 Tax=Propionivibrio sp. TaxID=2212460 RepID=UPI002610D597|nr:porin family protein [Propionivibrio sp.]
MNIIRTLSLLTLALCTAPAFATDTAFGGVGGAGWYAGAGLGYSTVKEDAMGNGYTINRDTHDTGYKLFGGYRFNSNFGIEGSYVDFGKEKFNWTYSPVESGSGTVSASTFALAATGRLPLGNSFALLGKLGAANTQVKYRESWSQPGYSENISNNYSSTAPVVGLGAGYAFGKNIGLRAEYESYGKSKMGDAKVKTDLLSISLGYHF